MDLKVLNFWQTYDCILRIAGMEIDGSGGELHSHCDGLSACHWSSQMSSSSLSLSFSMSIALSCSLSLLCSLLHYTTTTTNNSTTTTNNNNSSSSSSSTTTTKSSSSSKFITCHQLHDSCINSSKWWVSCIFPSDWLRGSNNACVHSSWTAYPTSSKQSLQPNTLSGTQMQASFFLLNIWKGALQLPSTLLKGNGKRELLRGKEGRTTLKSFSGNLSALFGPDVHCSI